MTNYAIFRAVALSKCPNFRKKAVAYLNSKLRPKRKKLPFIVYFSEDSTTHTLMFRVEHVEAGTSNRVFVQKHEDTSTYKRAASNLLIDASDGSNWHHKRFEFVQWMRAVLAEQASEKLINIIAELE